MNSNSIILYSNIALNPNIIFESNYILGLYSKYISLPYSISYSLSNIYLKAK